MTSMKYVVIMSDSKKEYDSNLTLDEFINQIYCTHCQLPVVKNDNYSYLGDVKVYECICLACGKKIDISVNQKTPEP